MKFLKILFTGFLLSIVALFVYLNCALYYQPDFVNVEGTEVNKDLLQQIKFLKAKMHLNAADDMQAYYPEGFIFMHALYSLALCEFSSNLPQKSLLYNDLHGEIQWSHAQMMSDKGRSIFYDSLPLPYGAYYAGWINYVLAKKLSIEDAGKRDSTEVNGFVERCNVIATVIEQDSSPFPESYPEMAWPADFTLCVASLALHDKMFPPRYEKIIDIWLEKAKAKLDSNGLIPHMVDAHTGISLLNAMGSSQSLMLNFLIDIDSAFAHKQFGIYKEKFLAYRLGLPGIREYPKGKSGNGHVDAGPIVWDIGGAASIVGLRTMALYGEDEVAMGLRNSIEAFGAANVSDDKKEYIFGLLPMADAFIAWANSTELNREAALRSNSNWHMTFQGTSLAIVLGIGVLLWLMWRHRRVA